MTIKRSTKFLTIIQFTRFAIIGASGTIISLGLLYLLTEFLLIKYWLALPIGYFIGITNNFIWNRKFTFEKTTKAISVQYVEYLLAMLIGGIGNYLTAIILTEIFSVWYFLSAVLAVSTSTIIDFILSKLWVFEQYSIHIVDTNEPHETTIKIKLVVSCLNEEKNVKEFITELFNNIASPIHLQVILIDNGSTDKTRTVINDLTQKYPDRVVPMYHKNPLKYGESIRKGLMIPTDFQPNFVGWAWSDNQITGQSVVKVLSGLSEGGRKFVKAIRHEKDYSFGRKVQSFFFNLIVSIIFGLKLQDVNGSPKVFAAEFLPVLDLQSEGWFLDAETYLKISRLTNESEIVSVPVSFNKRVHGKSKTSWFTAFELFYQILKFRFWGNRQWNKIIKAQLVQKSDIAEKPDLKESGESVQSVVGSK